MRMFVVSLIVNRISPRSGTTPILIKWQKPTDDSLFSRGKILSYAKEARK